MNFKNGTPFVCDIYGNRNVAQFSGHLDSKKFAYFPEKQIDSGKLFYSTL